MLDQNDINFFLEAHDSSTVGKVGISDVSVSCPICQEGKSWGKKHRLHLYTKPSYETPAVHCWNCGYSSNLYGYLKEYHTEIFERYIKTKKKESFVRLKDIQKDRCNECKDSEEDKNNTFLKNNEFSLYKEKNTKKILKEIEEINNIDINLIEPLKCFIPLSKSKEALEYLNKRKITPKDNWLFSPYNNKVTFEDKSLVLSNYIIIPLEKDNKWYGFQALGYKQKRFFIFLNKGNVSYKIWNWFNVDKDKPVYIFESIYDALSSGLDNIIAQLGATISQERLNELKEPIFCLDNHNVDERAKEESINYLKKGYKVFIWDKKIPLKDFNDLLKAGFSKESIKNLILSNINSGMNAMLKIKL